MKLLRLFFILLLSSFCTQAVEPEHEDVLITHTVQSGETLHSITRHYLGTDFLWKENWKLNPEIENPHVLKIGQQLQIIEQRIIPAQKAQVDEVVNQVEKKLVAEDWQTAQTGDELQQKEGIRTFKDSSALLQFSSESSLKILEYSQVFLQNRETTLRGTDSATIEIVKGDAELSWEPIATNSSEIQIVTGSATAKPSIGKGQTAELRAGIAESGNSTVSVYKGNSRVESAGSEVRVKQGMGVAVQPGLPPSKPKPLLSAPDIEKGSNLASYDYANPILKWNPVSSAQKYLVEICAQATCEKTLMQFRVEQPQVQISGFKRKGNFFWRVAGISEDQILGYRSEALPLGLTSAVEDTKGPVIALDMIGVQKHQANRTVIGPQTKINIISVDPQAGIKAIRYKWDEGSWSDWTDESFAVPSKASSLIVEAQDKLNQVQAKTYQFEYLL